MPQEEFEFTITADGEVRLETHGVKGKRCEEYLKYFEKLIGRVKEKQHTAEYYEPEAEIEVELELHQEVKS